MWDWIPEEERRVMADVFAMEDARNRKKEDPYREEVQKEEPEPKKSTGFPGSIYMPPTTLCNTMLDFQGGNFG